MCEKFSLSLRKQVGESFFRDDILYIIQRKLCRLTENFAFVTYSVKYNITVGFRTIGICIFDKNSRVFWEKDSSL